MLVSGIGNLRTQTHGSILVRHVRGGKLSAPHRNAYRFGRQQADIPVQPRTGIPARRLRFVLQPHGKRIGFSVLIYIRCDIAMERVIAERPEAGFLPVDIDTGFAHGSVKNQCSLFAGGNGKGGAIPAYAYIRQSARASGLYRSLFFEILRDGYFLQIVVTVERSVNGPIVRHGYRLPLLIVISRMSSSGYISPEELPALFQ